MFGWFGKNPEIGARFGSMMVAWMQNKPFWADEHAYPVRERLVSVEEPDGVLIVDIGGGKGHDLAGFKARYPELKGRLICQELPYLIPKIQVEGVEPMVHDFNTPQPIKGKHSRQYIDPGSNNLPRSTSVLSPPNPARLRRR